MTIVYRPGNPDIQPLPIPSLPLPGAHPIDIPGPFVSPGLPSNQIPLPQILHPAAVSADPAQTGLDDGLNGVFWIERRKLTGISQPTMTQEIKKFYAAIDADTFQKAAQVAAKSWLAKNAVGLTETLVVCAIPEAATACVSSSTGQALDLTVEITQAMIKELHSSNKLSEQEARDLSLLLDAASFAISTPKSLRDLTETVIVVLKTTEVLVQNENAKIVLKMSSDYLHKFWVVLQLVPK